MTPTGHGVLKKDVGCPRAGQCPRFEVLDKHNLWLNIAPNLQAEKRYLRTESFSPRPHTSERRSLVLTAKTSKSLKGKVKLKK